MMLAALKFSFSLRNSVYLLIAYDEFLRLGPNCANVSCQLATLVDI